VTTRAASAIVLAGGRSSRFGRDKLAELVDGRPLVAHAVEAVRAVAGDVLLVLGPDAPASDELGVRAVRAVRDPRPFEGPLAGLATGLEAVREPVTLVVGGDMPGLVPEVLAALLAALDDEAVEAVVLGLDHVPRPLPLAVRVGAATVAAGELLARGERSLRELLRVLRTSELPEADWRRLDPSAASLRDVDRPEDLPAAP